MSLLARFHHRTSRLASVGSRREHEAFVELLALAAFVDKAVSDAELSELAQFDASHASWDEEGFSVLQHLPVAIAKARASDADTLAALAAELTTPALREQAIEAVAHLLRADGQTAGESEFLTAVRAALA